MILRILALSLAILVTACEDESASTGHLEEKKVDQSPPVGPLGKEVIPLGYNLALTIDPRQGHFEGTTQIDIKSADTTDLIYLHGRNLEVSEASVIQADREITAIYEQVLDSGVARLRLTSPISPGDALISISYRAPFNTSSNALYSVESEGEHYAATQFQPIAARQVFPSFDDPGFKVPFSITITAVAGDVVVTTTPEIEAVTSNGMTTHRFERTRPLPTYLLAFVVGPYDVVTWNDIPANEIRDRALPLRGVAAKGQGEKLTYALSHTAGLLEILEGYFDIPYPYAKLDIIATPAGFGGAMENVGAIIYDEYLLLLNENSPMDQKRAYYAVHAHELAHMWFGNLVTPDWWTDIWLNESFATWMSYKAAHDYWPEGQLDRSLQKAAMFTMQNDSLISAREIREHVVHNDQIIDSFDGITYQKGGGVLGMIEKYAGEENFRNGIRHHLNRYADGVANAPQFMESLAQGAELAEIEPIFASFISQPGIPLIGVELSCEEKVELKLSQRRYAPLGSEINSDSAGWQVPVCIVAGSGGETRESCHLLEDSQQSYELSGECPDYVHPNADGAGYYRYTMDADNWNKLIDHSSAMPAGEALSLLDSLDAAYRAGEISEDIYFDALSALINHGDWNVVDTTTGYLEGMTDIFMPGDMNEVQRAFTAIAHHRYNLAKSAGPQILHDRMQRFMLIIARDPALRAPLADQATRFVGLNEDPDPSAIAPGQLETVLSIGVQDLGETFFDKLLALALSSTDPALSNAAIGALARVEDPLLVKKLQQAVMEGKFKGTEVTQVIFRQMVRLATTKLTYDWIASDPATILQLVPETFRPSTVPALGGFFCSSRMISDWEAMLKEHEELWPGYERSMRQSAESNHLCEGLRTASRSELLAIMKRVSP